MRPLTPQMAPIMWLHLYTLIIMLLIVVKSAVYFVSDKAVPVSKSSALLFTPKWMW